MRSHRKHNSCNIQQVQKANIFAEMPKAILDFGAFGVWEFGIQKHQIPKTRNSKIQPNWPWHLHERKIGLFGFFDFAGVVTVERAVLLPNEHSFAVSVGDNRNQSFMVGTGYRTAGSLTRHEKDSFKVKVRHKAQAHGFM